MASESLSPKEALAIIRMLMDPGVKSRRLPKAAKPKSGLEKTVSVYVNRINYAWGGTSSRYGMDCSAFTRFIIGKFGAKLPRTSKQQAQVGRYVPPEMLKTGDLVFFDCSVKRKGIDHVGIYLGRGRFVHSVSPKGVVLDTLPSFGFPVLFGRRVLS
ncbi:MAG: C40 family peptidase [Desulfobacterales bacterium]|uniref:C40 family peptidase n=2 Tax=Desulfobacterales TaxID=213118 RepID=A0A8J6NZD8_9BACT|nr:C40 family peptidase [Candidatus Desulfatibia vada]